MLNLLHRLVPFEMLGEERSECVSRAPGQARPPLPAGRNTASGRSWGSSGDAGVTTAFLKYSVLKSNLLKSQKETVSFQ